MTNLQLETYIKKRKDKIYLGVQHDGDNIAIGVLKMLSGNSLMGKCAKW
jgi:hypothetical protein